MAKVVCFDVGGVLIRITYRWAEAAQRAGVATRSDFPADAQLWDATFFVAYEGAEMDDAEYFRRLAEYLGEVSVADAERVHNHIMVEPYPRVDEIVRELNQQGYTTSCLSNTNKPHWHDMFNSGRFPANEAIPVRLASYLVGAPKPDPRMFSALEKETGVSGEDIVYFDDSSTNIAAAQSFGWRAFHIDPDQPTYPQIVAGLQSVGIRI